MRLPDEALAFTLTDVSRLMRREFAVQLKATPLTLAQARALVYVSRNEGLRQVELAALIEVQPMTLARLIDELGRRGLVERRADASDGRAYRLYLRPPARPQLERIGQAAAAARARALRGVDERKAVAALDVLRAMRDNLL